MLIAALVTIAKIWKQLKCPSTGEWRERHGIHTHTRMFSAINKTMPFAATWIDLEVIILSEISQTKTNII